MILVSCGLGHFLYSSHVTFVKYSYPYLCKTCLCGTVMRVESHLPGGTATGGCRGPDDPPPLDPTRAVHYTYTLWAITIALFLLVQLFCKIMPYHDNFWHRDPIMGRLIDWLSMVLRLHQHNIIIIIIVRIAYTADGFYVQVWWPNQQCQRTERVWLVIQTGLGLTRLTSPCYNNTTCMQILYKKII